MNIKQTIIVAAVTTLVVVGLAAVVGGNNQPQVNVQEAVENAMNRLGASGTRFPNGISADTTSPTSGQVRGTTFTSTGAGTFASASVTGTLGVTGETVVEGFTQGGGVLNISTTSAARTLTQAEMLASNVIEIESTVLGVALTLTLPATSTMSTLIGTAGNVRVWLIENNHTGAATTTTIAAGTGIDLLEPDGQNVVIGINNTATLKCWRKETTDVGCIVNETIPAD